MIKDGIYILEYLTTEFVNYLLAYTVIFGAGMNKQKDRWITTILAVVCFHIIVLAFFGKESSSAMSMFTMIVIPAVLLRPLEKKNFLLYPFVVIGTSVIGVSVSFLIALMFHIPEYKLTEGNGISVLCQCFSIILMILLHFGLKNKDLEARQLNFNWKQYVIFYVVMLCLFLMLAPMQSISRIYADYRGINLIGFSISIGCIVLVIITIWQGIIVNREVQLKERNKMYEKYIDLQKEYYSQLMKQDEKMRHFRHDMNAHIQVMRSYCESNDNSELKNYLERVMKESAICDVKSYTGNKGIDAVIGVLLSDAAKEQIRVEIKGRLPDQVKVSEYDLCTVMSNLLKNAIEACMKIADYSHRKIYIEIGAYNTQIYIQIKNTVKNNVVVENNRMITTKADAKEHGIGIINVEAAVKKYDGLLDLKCKDGWFIAEVNL